MPPSTRRRTVMRVWFFLTAILFLTRCADQIRPYWKTIVGAKETHSSLEEEHRAPAQRLGPLRLRVASWNLEWLDTPGRGPKPRGRKDYERLAQLARSLRADVIAVQEVASDLALALVFPPEQYGFYLAKRGGSQRSGFVFKRSLGTTMHPDLAALAGEHLRAGADLGVRMGVKELRLLSVHLKAFCTSGPLDAKDRDCAQLKAQLPALEGWVDDRTRDGSAFAVVGDLNRTLDEGDEVLLELDDADPANLKLAKATPGRRAACTRESHRAVDHVLLGGQAVPWLVPNSFMEVAPEVGRSEDGLKLSDHCPLVIELQSPPG
jgi:endonuclease/exonuclease/phosphatase family metal-dependent hydrolase